MTKKFRLKELVTQDAHHAIECPTTIENSQFAGWLVVQVPSHTDLEQLDRLRSLIHQAFGSKVLIVSDDVKFFVFEEVGEIGSSAP